MEEIIDYRMYGFLPVGGSVLSAQPSCETKEEVTFEQLNRTKKGLDAMMKELKNNSWYQSELNKVASLATPSEQMQAYKSLAGRLISVLEIQAELEWMKPEAIQGGFGYHEKEFGL